MAEPLHVPTDGRLDYCVCGVSWPCPLTDQPLTDPDQVLIAGDWHGNTNWAANVIEHMPQFVPEGRRLILHTGDFGVWPTRPLYLTDLTDILIGTNTELWFVDGNHENHRALTELMAARPEHERRTPPYEISGNIFWLPRGYRWPWHGRTWLALGGTTSVDRPVRTPGVDWWAHEAIHYSDVQAAVEGGPVDVMVTHDCPQGVPMNLPRDIPGWWELGPAEEHRRVLRGVVDQVRPSWLFHGHYHLFHDTVAQLDGHRMSVIGLDCDEAPSGNSVLCDVRTMAVVNPWVEVPSND